MKNRELLDFAGEAKPYLRKCVGVQWLRLLANIIFSFLLSFILYLLLTGISTPHVWWSLLPAVGLLLLRRLFIRQTGHFSSLLVGEIKRSVRVAFSSHIFALGPAYIGRISTADVLHDGVDTIEQLENYFGSYLPQYYYCLISGATLFLALLPVSWKVAALLLVLTPVIPLLLRAIVALVRRMQKTYWKTFGDVGALFLDSIQGMSTLKIFSADQRREEEIEATSEAFRVETMRILKMQLSSMIVVNWVAYGSTAAGIIAGLYQLRTGEINLWGMILILFLAAEFFVPMRALTSTFHVAMTGAAAAESMLAFLKENPNIRSGDRRLPQSFDIEIRNLDFCYDADDSFSIEKLNVRIPARSLTAIVGASGSGKSTLISLLSAQIDPPAGSIFLDGHELHSYQRNSIVREITRVAHDAHVFEGTVRSNLLLARADATDEEMTDVLKRLSLWSLFAAQDGLETKIQSQGRNLSGGEAQRLALAAALLHRSKVYIFDEVTSNVDADSEAIIMRTIYDLARTATVILVSHRLYNVIPADLILLMDQGSIREQGTHQSLSEAGGYYARLFREQAELEQFVRGGRS